MWRCCLYSRLSSRRLIPLCLHASTARIELYVHSHLSLRRGLAGRCPLERLGSCIDDRGPSHHGLVNVRIGWRVVLLVYRSAFLLVRGNCRNGALPGPPRYRRWSRSCRQFALESPGQNRTRLVILAPSMTPESAWGTLRTSEDRLPKANQGSKSDANGFASFGIIALRVVDGH